MWDAFSLLPTAACCTVGGNGLSLFVTLSKNLQDQTKMRIITNTAGMYKNTPMLLRLQSHRLVEDGDGLGVIVAADQSLHVEIQHRQAQLQDGLYAVIEKTVDHVHGALYGQDTDEEGEKPGQGHGGEETQVRHVLHQLGEVLSNQVLEHRLVDQSA